MAFEIPGDDKRCTILGRTGTGKSVAAVHQLSLRSWHRMPWIVFDYKGDRLIQKLVKLGYAKRWKISDGVPMRAGIFVVSPVPDRDDEAVNEFLMKVWARGRCGLYFDEGYMVSEMPALNAIYTQGRSKKIPVIALFQRPVWMNRFQVSECDYFQVFAIADERDRKTVYQYCPPFRQADGELRKFESVWYDVAAGDAVILTPAPDEGTILQTFADRLRPRRI